MATRRAGKATTMSAHNSGGRYAGDAATEKEASPLEIDAEPTTVDEQYQSEREQAKLRHWKESEHAAGLVEPTWADELESYRRRGCCCCPSREEMGQLFRVSFFFVLDFRAADAWLSC